MARIQQSILVKAPGHVAYDYLTRFEGYPLFLQDVALVQRTDETHVHCCASVAGRNIEWDAEITEQIHDRRIAWRNLSGPAMEATLQVDPIHEDMSRVMLTLDCDPPQLAPPASQEAAALVARHVGQDLLALKQMLEQCLIARGISPVDIPGAVTPGTADDQSFQGIPEAGMRGDASVLSEASLSQSSDPAQDERFRISEEQNLDQQSDEARRVGQPPQELEPAPGQESPQEAVEKTMRAEDTSTGT